MIQILVFLQHQFHLFKVLDKLGLTRGILASNEEGDTIPDFLAPNDEDDTILETGEVFHFSWFSMLCAIVDKSSELLKSV